MSTPRAEAEEGHRQRRLAEAERRAAAETARRQRVARDAEAERQAAVERAAAKRQARAERQARVEQEKAAREEAERQARAERMPGIRAACVEAAIKGEEVVLARADMADVYREVGEDIERASRLMFFSAGISRLPFTLDPETARVLALLLAPAPGSAGGDALER